MIGENTRGAILALLAVDAGATDEERRTVAAALSGTSKLLTVAEAARRLGVSRPTIYRIIRNGGLALTRDGRLTEAALSDFLSRRNVA